MKIDNLEIATEQLGYSPTIFVKVTSRNKKGMPIVIQMYTLYGEHLVVRTRPSALFLTLTIG
jgi:hypothetical protein